MKKNKSHIKIGKLTFRPGINEDLIDGKVLMFLNGPHWKLSTHNNSQIHPSTIISSLIKYSNIQSTAQPHNCNSVSFMTFYSSQLNQKSFTGYFASPFYFIENFEFKYI